MTLSYISASFWWYVIVNLLSLWISGWRQCAVVNSMSFKKSRLLWTDQWLIVSTIVNWRALLSLFLNVKTVLCRLLVIKSSLYCQPFDFDCLLLAWMTHCWLMILPYFWMTYKTAHRTQMRAFDSSLESQGFESQVEFKVPVKVLKSMLNLQGWIVQ